MFMGIDLGTSGVKAILLDRGDHVIASASAALSLLPQPAGCGLWREQAPADWWRATEEAVVALLASARAGGADPSAIEAIGLTGQMHGATVLDADGEVLRPAILWNDGRSFAECAELEQRVPQSRAITGNIMMPGFTAPKLLWLARHEPKVFERIAKVLLPKDWLRFRLTGVYASDMSDAAGTMWLDVARRDWSDALLAATGLTRSHMPSLHEGPQITGSLDPAIARRWGLAPVPVVAGAGDNAAGAIGVGIVRPGQAMLSLGTSGVYFAASDGFLANPERAVHSFCHALPSTWHLMSVMLSAAACLDFTARLTGYADVPALLADAERHEDGLPNRAAPLFLPYLSGERTPHNDPNAQGVFFGLNAATVRADLARATLEGVGFGLCDGIEAVAATGLVAADITLIGGGSRSAYWAQMLADITGCALTRREGGDVGPALGAARLARLGMAMHTGEPAPLAEICPVPRRIDTFEPDAGRHRLYAERRETFQRLYRQLQPLFAV
ncbi:MAG: xylulokinase [Paludibacterium sp.]|uniref:xylulokinase n=1 Tax=Paludibacterium sp. TaxID=1917523 RepID=UPI0025DE9C31|nr:xylulokinase [Paludibacterium sp.]MBV8049130.1 xylulokinase [Paludibacterium sp.]MBV8646967.1 xylulokinase [Paludibacterium sp.]